MLKLQGRQARVLKDFKDKVVRELGPRINAIIVYGSAARGEAGEESDIDVLVVGRDKEIGGKLSEIGYEVDYENSFETFITPIYYTEEEVENRIKAGSPFIHEVLKDRVALYDDGTFKRIREKMFKAGR